MQKGKHKKKCWQDKEVYDNIKEHWGRQERKCEGPWKLNNAKIKICKRTYLDP